MPLSVTFSLIHSSPQCPALSAKLCPPSGLWQASFPLLGKVFSGYHPRNILLTPQPQHCCPSVSEALFASLSNAVTSVILCDACCLDLHCTFHSSLSFHLFICLFLSPYCLPPNMPQAIRLFHKGRIYVCLLHLCILSAQKRCFAQNRLSVNVL